MSAAPMARTLLLRLEKCPSLRPPAAFSTPRCGTATGVTQPRGASQAGEESPHEPEAFERDRI
jgi:hypothetical protein